MKAKVVTILMLVFIIGSLVFFFLWRSTATSLKYTKTELETAQSTILALNNDTEKLLEYITKKESTIKELEKKYNEALTNIPSDECGDAKPSEELLTYFKKAYSK